jgi:hypothetical protein
MATRSLSRHGGEQRHSERRDQHLQPAGVLGTTLDVDPSAAAIQRKSNSGKLGGRS